MKEKSRYFYYSSMALIFVYMASRTWCRLGNLIIDTFRDQIAAYKLAHGAILYKDVYYLFGLLPPYLLALLNIVFGTTLYCSMGLGFAMVLACSFAMYRISRFYVNRFFSTVVVLNFLGCFAFSNLAGGIGNFIMPYSLASYLAITFTMLASYFFICFIHKGNRRDLALWALMAYLTFLSRIYIGIPTYAFFLFFGVIHKRKRILETLPLFLFPMVVTLLTYAAYLITTGSWHAFQGSVLSMFFYEGSGVDPFAKINMGLLAIGEGHEIVNVFAKNVFVMFKMFFGQIITMSVLYLAGLLFAVNENFFGVENWKKRSIYSLYIIVSIFVVYSLLPHEGMKVVSLTYRSAPLILFSSIILIVWMYLKNGYQSRYYSAMVLCATSLMLLARVFFTVGTNGYGNYLALPASIAMILFFVLGIPLIFNELGVANTGRKFYFIACAVYFIINISVFMKETFINTNFRQHCEHTSFGKMYSSNSGTTKFFWQTVRYIDSFTPKDSTVLVVPEGFGINYFSQRAAPMKYDNYLPSLVNRVGEDEVVAELSAGNIDYVVEMQRTSYEHGYSSFGHDYGSKIRQWIIANYVLIRQFGNTPFDGSDLPGIMIFKKKYER